MCRYCWESPIPPDSLWERDDAYEEREIAWEATPDYEELMERGDDVLAEEEPDSEWPVWLAEGERRVPNRGHYA